MFKILLAEDDRELRQLFQHVLTKNGYTAVGVSNGLEALEALEGGYFDLLISDIMMPKMDGYTLVRRAPLEKADEDTQAYLEAGTALFEALTAGAGR